MIFLMLLILKCYFPFFCNLKSELWSFVILESLEINPDVRKTKAFNQSTRTFSWQRGVGTMGEWGWVWPQ